MDGEILDLVANETVEEEIKLLKERITYKDKRRQMAEDQRNYKLCDEIVAEISALSKVLEQELKELRKKTIDQRVIIPRKSHYLVLHLTILQLVLSHHLSLKWQVPLRVMKQ